MIKNTKELMFKHILKLKQKQHLILNQLNNKHYNETKFKEKIKELVRIRNELDKSQKSNNNNSIK